VLLRRLADGTARSARPADFGDGSAPSLADFARSRTRVVAEPSQPRTSGRIRRRSEVRFEAAASDQTRAAKGATRKPLLMRLPHAADIGRRAAQLLSKRTVSNFFRDSAGTGSPCPDLPCPDSA